MKRKKKVGVDKKGGPLPPPPAATFMLCGTWERRKRRHLPRLESRLASLFIIQRFPARKNSFHSLLLHSATQQHLLTLFCSNHQLASERNICAQ